MSARFTYLELFNFLVKEGLLSQDQVTGFICDDSTIEGFSSIHDSKPNTISWMKDQPIDWSLVKSKVIICDSNYNTPKDSEKIFIKVDKPRFAFIKIMKKFLSENKKNGTEKTAIMGINCKLGNNTYIGHYVVIGDDVIIGDNTIIHCHVSIYDGCTIGSNCIIHSGSVIGADGFGYEKDEEGQVLKFPHISGVIIGSDVEIKSNVCINRGSLTPTTIGDHDKINDLCQIGHGVRISNSVLIGSGVSIAGNTTVENDSWIGPRVVIKDQLEIGSHSYVAIGSVVLRNVKAHDKVLGFPAKSIKE